MSEFLLEFFTEEIPSRMQNGACEYLKTFATDTLKSKNISFADLKGYVTPRRLVLHITGLPLKGPDYTEERKGPSVDAPAAAIQGFLKSTGVTLEQCTQQDMGKKGNFLCATLHHKGENTQDILAELIDGLIKTFPWPKSMRWGNASFMWVRPIRSILAIFNGEVVPYQLPGHDVTSSNQTQGHRFMSPHHFKVQGFADYESQLRKNYVILDPQERLKLIQERSQKLADAKGLKVKFDPKLLDEVCGLVEWPQPLMGKIDDQFMDIPPEVLITSMKVHQRYLSLEDQNGKIAPYFILISNMETADDGAQIVQGNERVLRARLSDAAFFWNTDRKKSLIDWHFPLEGQIFHEKLGTMAEKVFRVGDLVDLLVPDEKQRTLAYAAARISKADLMTGMVGEFPELQGIMGGYYALHEGFEPEVAAAIRDQYKPAGPNDSVPQGEISQALALADKIDSLVGFFAVGIEPSSSKDPYALRRHALGIIRIILENKISMDLRPVLQAAYKLLKVKKNPVDQVMKSLDTFLSDRLRVYLKAAGYPHNHVSAVLGDSLESGNLLHILLKLQAFSDLLNTADGDSLILTYKRAAGIVKDAESKTKSVIGTEVNSDLLVENAEKKLYQELVSVNQDLKKLLDNAHPDFKAAMTLISKLRPTIDTFFEEVTVQSQDAALTQNRLKLLSFLRQIFHKIANFGELV